MKRTHLTLGISLFAGLLLAGITHADSPTTSPADPNELAKLRHAVAQLYAENTTLRQKLLEAQRELNLVRAPQFNLDVQPVVPGKVPSTIAPGAVPHLFNGTTYYTIPVNAPQP
jgi:hypothetical protein